MVEYSQYFDDIERWIDEKGSVTYRGFACGLNVSATAAKCALYRYAEKCDKPMKSTVLEVGRDGAALFSFKFTTLNDFSAVQKLLGDARDKHIYALHCVDSSEHPNLAMQGHDLNQVEEATRGSSTLTAFSTNSVGLVHMTGIDSNVRKIRPAPTASSNGQPASKNVSAMKTSKPTATVASSASETKAKLATKASAIFGNAAKSTEKKAAENGKGTTVAVKKAIPVKQAAPVVEEAKKKTIVEEEWDDEDSDDEATAGKRGPDKEKIKKRKVSACAPKGTGGVHQSDVILNENEILDTDSDDDNDTKKKKSKKSKAADEVIEKVVFKKHGAMDDFMEDAAIKARAEQGSAPVGGDGLPQKAKRKKLVEKMFADEKGYLVTEMVMEEVSDDDTSAEEPLKHPQSNPKPAPIPVKKAKPTPAPAKKGKSTGQQKSMMSFFSKK